MRLGTRKVWARDQTVWALVRAGCWALRSLSLPCDYARMSMRPGRVPMGAADIATGDVRTALVVLSGLGMACKWSGV